MDVLMFQGLGMYGSEVAANTQIHINSCFSETGFRADLQNETHADRSHPLNQETVTGQ
jgi:hypothetical protein